jgi:S1-C subfamily serine protease
MRTLLLGVILSFAATTTGFAQEKQRFTDQISQAQSSVVQVLEIIEDVQAIRDASLRNRILALGQGAPGGFPEKIVIGTGVIVGTSGEVITANHVITYLLQDISVINAAGGRVAGLIGVVERPAQTSTGTEIFGNSRTYSLTVLAQDPIHDLALIRAANSDIFAPTRVVKSPGYAPQSARIASISEKHLEDGEDIFVCGFPNWSDSLITTSGRVATAWSSEGVPDQNNGIDEVDKIKLDIRINSGNSGGPVFDSDDGSLVAIVEGVQSGAVSSGGLGIAIPAKYVTELLDRQHVKWNASSVSR